MPSPRWCSEALSRSTFGFIAPCWHTDMASPISCTRARRLSWTGIFRHHRGELITAVAAPQAPTRLDARHPNNPRAAVAITALNGARCSSPTGACGLVFRGCAYAQPDARGSLDIWIFKVKKVAPGFRVGRALKKTGWLCSDTAELVFEDCRIPVENLLGEENAGFYAVMKNFQVERIALSAMAVGHAMTALSLTLD
jgi:acyl-CoA dehydrogenase